MDMERTEIIDTSASESTLRDLIEDFRAARLEGGKSFHGQALTAFRHLTDAIGHPPETIPVRGLLLDLGGLDGAVGLLRTFMLGGESSPKRRHAVNNYANCLRRALTWALAANYPLLAARPGADPAGAGARPDLDYPRDAALRALTPTHYRYPYHAWPIAVQHEFDAFEAWATAPMAEGRRMQNKIRATTITNYRCTFERYLGYLCNIAGVVEPTTFSAEQFYDVVNSRQRLMQFANWYIGRQQAVRKDSSYCPPGIYRFLSEIATFTTRFHDRNRGQRDPEKIAALYVLQSLAPETPLRPRNRPIPSIGAVLHACVQLDRWAIEQPHNNAIRRATLERLSCMLRLMCFIPLRRLNWVNARLGQQIYRDQTGWHLHFLAHEVKNGRELFYDLDSWLWPHLDAWVQAGGPRAVLLQARPLYRPAPTTIRRSTATDAAPGDSTVMFPSPGGGLMAGSALETQMRHWTYAALKVPIHPHLLRDIVATTILEHDPRELLTVADILGDSVAMVISHYSHITERQSAQRAARLIHDLAASALHPDASSPAPAVAGASPREATESLRRRVRSATR